MGPTRRSLPGVALLAACIAVSGPVELRPHVGDRQSLPPATQLRIAVAPFRDARLQQSRDPFRPALRIARFGLVRSGEYSTGDRSFSGDVADYARADAAATLAHSGVFAEVRALPAAPEHAADAGADLLLYGEVEEFVGLQNGRVEISPVHLPPVLNRFETPIGLARVLYRMVDSRGAIRFEKRIDTQLSVRGLDREQAALDALAETSEQLAQELYRLLVPSPQLRSVPLLVLDGCGLGEKRVSRLMEDVNEVFEREVQLRFAAELRAWVHPAQSRNLDKALEAVKRISAPAGGVLLALVPSRDGLGSGLRTERSGLAAQLGEHALVLCGADMSLRTVTVIHEIGHLLGAVHVAERSSIMFPVAEFDGRFFDDWNRRILRAARERQFGSPLSAALRAELRALYESSEAEQAVSASDLQAALSTVR